MAKCYSKRKLRGKRVAITATSVVADDQTSEVGAPLSLPKEQLGIGKTDRDVLVQCEGSDSVKPIAPAEDGITMKSSVSYEDFRAILGNYKDHVDSQIKELADVVKHMANHVFSSSPGPALVLPVCNSVASQFVHSEPHPTAGSGSVLTGGHSRSLVSRIPPYANQLIMIAM